MKIIKFAFPILLCLAVGYVSGDVTRESIATWYVSLNKPFFNPPNWIFAPVWTILYVLMGIAAGLIWNEWKENKEVVKKALVFFTLQLALNALWSYLFFGLHNPLLALLEIIILELMIYETYIQFKSIHKTAGYLLIPYLAWVAFATVLTASIWWLNS
ncbi:TspO/MBR family protein [Flavobacterium agrisoli]|uniref:Tryptophan-rich sensory protein n=1 Tax=Flavobacterium agrisoli TaxID=2793066 RepID=A0A934PN61_9FLAO|nr:TspO/MBR family protein [Flavobacterium agrisoli]MBK0370582.1 tryptophan-rich sensory protein [Flavobacterium agrisoli]